MSAGMERPVIRFLFDFISPYSYLGWTQIHGVARRAGADVEPVPVLFAALLDAHGQKGPGEIAPKRVYLFKDVFRRAHALGVPFAPPPAHPFNPLLALRVASLPLDTEARRRLIDGLFKAVWGGGGGVESPAAVAPVLAEAGLDGEAILREAQTPEAKARLRAQTDEAVAAGAFGVPTMIVGGELFWGADSLGHLEAYLRGEDPMAGAGAELLARWMAAPATATRKGAGTREA
jgi:2-hydroxychromene-2-carboxylate isomerase